MAKADTRRAWLRSAEGVLAALVLAVGGIGLALFPVTTPVYVRALVTAVDASELTGLGVPDTLAAAESVRLFVVDPDAPELAATMNGQAAFDEAAVSHLIDVRDVLVPARWLSAGLLAIAAVWLAVRRRTPEGRASIRRACRIAGWGLLGAIAAAAAAALVDFNAFFAVFHSLFFEAGTWMFPADSLLIRVFPLPFWMAAGATWAGLIFAEGLILAVIGRSTPHTARAERV